MRTQVTFIFTQYLKTGVNIISMLTLLLVMSSTQIAPVLMALSVLNFYIQSVECFLGESYVMNLERYRWLDRYKLFTISIVIAFVSILILWVLFELEIIEFLNKYFFHVILGLLFSSGILLKRTHFVLKGRLLPIIIANVAEVFLLVSVSVLAITEAALPLIVMLLFMRYPLVNIVFTMAIISQDFVKLRRIRMGQYTIVNLTKVLSLDYKSATLSINLALKSFLHNQDVVLVGLYFGDQSVVIYKFFTQVKSLVSDLIGSFLQLYTRHIIADGKLTENTRKYVFRIIWIAISFCLAFCFTYPVLLAIPYLESLESDFIASLINFKAEMLWYALLVILPFSSTQWTRLVLMISNKVNASSYIHLLLVAGLALSVALVDSFASFIVAYGLCVSLLLTGYGYYVLNLTAENMVERNSLKS